MAMPTFPRGSAVPPQSIRIQKNGALDTSKLTAVQTSYLAPIVAKAWLAFSALSADHGWPLTYTHGGLYRTTAQQEATFFSRYSWPYDPAIHKTTDTRQYEGRTWFLRKGMAPAAAPSGNAPHCWAVAIDAAIGTHPNNAKSVTEAWAHWAVTEAHNYGLRWSLQSEPWHLQWYFGDLLPPALQHQPPPPIDPPVDPPKGIKEVSKLIQPYFGLIADPALFYQIGRQLEWLVDQAQVDAWKYIESVDGNTEFTTPPGHGLGAGAPWPIAVENLKLYTLIGAAPGDPDAGPTGGGRITSNYFLRQVK